MVKGKRKGKAGALRRIGRCWQLYVLMLPALVYIVLFAYKPMYGILIAFKDYSMKKGILASPWVSSSAIKPIWSSVTRYRPAARRTRASTRGVAHCRRSCST